MSQQDKANDILVNHQVIKQVVDEFFPVKIFARKKPGESRFWNQRYLAIVAFLWMLHPKKTMVKCFLGARKVLGKIFRLDNGQGTSYQGFTKALAKVHLRLMLTVTPHLRLKMKENLPGQWEVEGYVLFAGDGSRIELARTKSLQDAFAPKRSRATSSATKKKTTQQKTKAKTRKQKQRKKQKQQKQSAESVEKKANSPQMWLTMLWHVGSGLPWSWRSGPSDSSERADLQSMLDELPENALLTMDAGFVGYDFWASILEKERDFLVRVGSNVSLLRNLGYAREHEHTVYLWPQSAANKNQPPLTLRLIVAHNGKHPVYLVTNLSKSRLSDKAACAIYKARWGVELFFRTLKQTFGRRKLRAESAPVAQLELDWSLLALWCVCLSGQMELLAAGEPPDRLSPALALDAYADVIGNYRVRPESADETLWSQLGSALQDDYTRQSSKTSRDYPRQKKRNAPGSPEITNATKKQMIAAKEMKENQKMQLTA